MMHHSRALILRKDEWGEADLRITALTSGFGKIRLLAQGARKHGAKLQGHLEPGAISDISFVIGRNSYRLTTARLAVFPRAGMDSFPKLAAHAAILGVLDANLLEERDHAAELLEMTEVALLALERADDPATVRRLLVWFPARLLLFLGMFPSPLSPEARAVPSLPDFVACSPVSLNENAFEPEVLERELAWLLRRLGDAFAAMEPVSAAS